MDPNHARYQLRYTRIWTIQLFYYIFFAAFCQEQMAKYFSQQEEIPAHSGLPLRIW